MPRAAAEKIPSVSRRSLSLRRGTPGTGPLTGGGRGAIPASARFRGWALGILLLGTLGCPNHDAVLGVAPAVPAGSQVSLARDVQPIFTAGCAFGGCHAPPLGAPMSLLSSDSYASLVGAPSCEAPTLKRVDPGSSATSYLVIKLEGKQLALQAEGACGGCPNALQQNPCGQRMPLGGPSLNSTVIQLVRDWIDQGAKNN